MADHHHQRTTTGEETRHINVGSRLRLGASPWLTAGTLALADLVTISIAVLLGIYLRLIYDGHFEPIIFLQLWPALFLFILVFAARGLYAAIAQGPADEIRRICQSVILVFLALATITYLSGRSDAYSRGVFVIAIVCATVLVPLGRVGIRHLCRRARWWGNPCVIFGAGEMGSKICRNLQSHPELGLKVAAILDDRYAGEQIDGVPILRLRTAHALATVHKIPYAIVGQPLSERRDLLALIEQEAEHFRHLIIVPDIYGVASLWVESQDLGGILGLEVKRRLLMPGPRLTKRVIDLFGAIVGGLLIALPVTILIAIAIKLDSRGPIFYSQRRLGRHGKHFRAWKFRSMVADADAVLEQYLADHPDLREEWEREHKLRNDPRVTRVGRFLRGSSLDELPQLWNVLRGEMSMVGPRPIVDAEVEKYGRNYSLYSKVLPGMSGLWQVSGRSDTDYEGRVSLDVYYVRNWSVWLDAWILARTVKTVILGKGAY